MTRLSVKIIVSIVFLVFMVCLGKFIMLPNNYFDVFNRSFLINYSDGFIRRGLLGELIKILHNICGIDVLFFIKYFSLLCYFSFCGYMLYLFRKNKISIFFLLLPYVLPYYALISYINIRDFFLLILFSISLHYLKNKTNKIFLFFTLNIITIVGTLTHEMYFFFSVPLFSFLFLLKEFWNKKDNILLQLFYSSIFFIPSIAVLLLSIYFPGDIKSASIIYNDILLILPDNINGKEGVGIPSIGGTLSNQLSYMYRDLNWNGFSRGISYSLFFIVILYLFLNFDKLNFNLFGKENLRTINPKFLTSIFLIQFIAFLPIFIVAIDWQRWFSIIIYTSLLVSIQFIDYQVPPPPTCHCYGVSRIGKVKDIIYYWVEVIPSGIKNLYSKFISSDENIVRFVALFCIIPYYPLGNTPYQFSNIFIMLHNFLSKVIYIVLN